MNEQKNTAMTSEECFMDLQCAEGLWQFRLGTAWRIQRSGPKEMQRAQVTWVVTCFWECSLCRFRNFWFFLADSQLRSVLDIGGLELWERCARGILLLFVWEFRGEQVEEGTLENLSYLGLQFQLWLHTVQYKYIYILYIHTILYSHNMP